MYAAHRGMYCAAVGRGGACGPKQWRKCLRYRPKMPRARALPSGHSKMAMCGGTGTAGARHEAKTKAAKAAVLWWLYDGRRWCNQCRKYAAARRTRPVSRSNRVAWASVLRSNDFKATGSPKWA